MYVPQHFTSNRGSASAVNSSHLACTTQESLLADLRAVEALSGAEKDRKGKRKGGRRKKKKKEWPQISQVASWRK